MSVRRPASVTVEIDTLIWYARILQAILYNTPGGSIRYSRGQIDSALNNKLALRMIESDSVVTVKLVGADSEQLEDVVYEVINES